MANRLPRLKPSPLPSIHPVPEYLADAALKNVYDDMKATLQVPWMAVATMAFAHYPTFFNILWDGLRELSVSREFVEACRRLRVFVEEVASELEPRSIVPALLERGYARQEIKDIRALNGVFSHGNMPYILISTVARLLLEGNVIGEKRPAEEFKGRHGPSSQNRLLLMEPHHVDAPTAAVYESIRTTLGLPFVNTDYRAFARWPSYFALAWKGLSGKASTPEYESRVAAVHDFAVELVKDLPNPAGLSPEELMKATGDDGAPEEILDVVHLFQWLLPGLAVNVAFFRVQLAETG